MAALGNRYAYEPEKHAALDLWGAPSPAGRRFLRQPRVLVAAPTGKRQTLDPGGAEYAVDRRTMNVVPPRA
jgi:hypothetical protein